MPRTTRAQISFASSRMQKKARELLVGLGHEIRLREADLGRLKKEASQLSAIVDRRGTDRAKPASGGLPVRRPASTGAWC